jgi:hypothetical protein
MEDIFAGGFFFPGPTPRTSQGTADEGNPSGPGRKNPLFRMQLGWSNAFSY